MSDKLETVGIDKVVEAVGKALEEAQANNVEGFPPLKSVEISLSVVNSKEGGGSLKILFFSVGGKISGEDVSTIKLKMEPPPTKKAIGLKKSYDKSLAAALNVAKEGVIAAGEELPNLITSNVEIEVAFTVTKQGESGISIDPIGIGDLSVGIGADGKLSKSQVHTLKLVFEKK
jgi:hypothetical protein